MGGLSKNRASRPKLLLRLSVVLTIFAILIFLAQLWNSNQSIHQISIVGTSFLTPAEVKAEIEGTPILNTPKNKINYTEIAKKLQQNPFIEETYLSEGINSLTIEVKERQPIALFADNYGKVRYIDRNGVILPYRLFYSSIDLPVITGVYHDELLDSAKLLAAVNIIKQIKQISGNLLYNLISEIHYDRTTRNFILYTSDETTKIIFGTNDNVDEKIKNLSDFLKFQLNYIGRNEYSYVDVRWKDKIVVKN